MNILQVPSTNWEDWNGATNISGAGSKNEIVFFGLMNPEFSWWQTSSSSCGEVRVLLYNWTRSVRWWQCHDLGWYRARSNKCSHSTWKTRRKLIPAGDRYSSRHSRGQGVQFDLNRCVSMSFAFSRPVSYLACMGLAWQKKETIIFIIRSTSKLYSNDHLLQYRKEYEHL